MSAEAPAIPAQAARRVRLVVLDVDGVLTDGAVYVGASDAGAAIELKRFDVTDGLGVKFLKDAGIDVAFLSARPSEATRLRAAELGVADVFQDPEGRKVPILERLLAAKGLRWDEVAFVGDDLADLGALRRVGLAATPANGLPDARREAVWRGRRAGGRGAVREFAEALLRARGQWDDLVDAYCRAREG